MILPNSIISAYGENISCGTNSFKGFLSPIDAHNAEKKHLNLPAGVANAALYLLITNTAISENETVSAHGKSYDALRVEPIFLGGEVSHYECVLRPKGSVTNV